MGQLIARPFCHMRREIRGVHTREILLKPLTLRHFRKGAAARTIRA